MLRAGSPQTKCFVTDTCGNTQVLEWRPPLFIYLTAVTPLSLSLIPAPEIFQGKSRWKQ